MTRLSQRQYINVPPQRQLTVNRDLCGAPGTGSAVTRPAEETRDRSTSSQANHCRPLHSRRLASAGAHLQCHAAALDGSSLALLIAALGFVLPQVSVAIAAMKKPARGPGLAAALCLLACLHNSAILSSAGTESGSRNWIPKAAAAGVLGAAAGAPASSRPLPPPQRRRPPLLQQLPPPPRKRRSPHTGLTPPFPIPLLGWEHLWSDEFQGNVLDDNKWEAMVGDGSAFGIPGW